MYSYNEILIWFKKKKDMEEGNDGYSRNNFYLYDGKLVVSIEINGLLF